MADLIDLLIEYNFSNEIEAKEIEEECLEAASALCKLAYEKAKTKSLGKDVGPDEINLELSSLLSEELGPPSETFTPEFISKLKILVSALNGWPPELWSEDKKERDAAKVKLFLNLLILEKQRDALLTECEKFLAVLQKKSAEEGLTQEKKEAIENMTSSFEGDKLLELRLSVFKENFHEHKNILQTEANNQEQIILNSITAILFINPSYKPYIEAQEKQKWAKEAIQEFKQCFKDENKMVAAFKHRQSLKMNNESVGMSRDLKPSQLALALTDIDMEEKGMYEIEDPARLGTNLMQVGFSQEDLNAVKQSDILKLEAALFYALGEIYLQYAMPYYLSLNEEFKLKESSEEAEQVLLEYMDSKLQLLFNFLPLLKYFIAKAKLQKKLEDKKIIPALEAYGRNILKEMERIEPLLSLKDLTDTLDVTYKMIVSPSKDAADACKAQGEKIIAKYPKAKHLANLMFGLAGVGLIVLSLVTAGATFGTTTPLNLAGVIAGAALIAVSLGFEGKELVNYSNKIKLKKNLVGFSELFKSPSKKLDEEKLSDESLQEKPLTSTAFV